MPYSSGRRNEWGVRDHPNGSVSMKLTKKQAVAAARDANAILDEHGIEPRFEAVHRTVTKWKPVK